ncbi:MAG: helix-turn-helix domain-containing protein [Acidobacteria bacterium]|nr:helix-turn-helix domain-containing protein [Acidobacteriota bacterium]MBI3427467.1 helix-turn-helix domain-containing protein [Acidobacteriota bacterium]
MEAQGTNTNRFAHGLQFEPYAIDHLVDSLQHHHLPLDPEFPFAIKALSYESFRSGEHLTWHNRLELFCPVSGAGRFQMGERLMDFKSGDVLVVDNLKLHGAFEFNPPDSRSIVIYFRAELFYNLGSSVCDYAYLMPFYGLAEDKAPILRAAEPASAAVHEALDKLLRCYFDAPPDQYSRIGCKAYLSEVLYLLSRHFGTSDMAQAEYLRRREQAQRLGALLEYLNHGYGEKITAPQAATMAGMSQSHFMRFFKRATGMTFVDYLTQLRVGKARQLLRDQTLSIAEISNLVGFADQSYFDKRFKERFGKTPREYRVIVEPS